MIRTVEVGRAVLASSTQHLELWLTTLIEISPSQHSTNIEKLSSLSLLRYLSSGNAWVSRGNGMRIELVLNLRGEPFPKQELQELRDRITRAPIWSQLNLKPSIPTDDVLQNGAVHIAINHFKDEGAAEGKRYHRIFDNVPAADIKPPESMPQVQLQVVRFNIDILESKVRLQMKRSNTLPNDMRYENDRQRDEDEQDEDFGTQLDKAASSSENDHLKPSLTTPPSSRKRKRPDITASSRTTSSPVLSIPREARSCNFSGREVLTKEQLADMQLMVEGAMRLSIFGTSKLSTGIKVKANSFVVGLADVAPVLWRPGYLSALSRRAHLISTISRSFGHVAGMKATTVSLDDKVKRLISSALSTELLNGFGQSSDVDTQSGSLSSSFADYLWLHLQRTLLTRPAQALQAFVASKLADHPDSDVILDVADRQRKTSAIPPLTIEKGPISNTVDSDNNGHSVFRMPPRTYQRIEQDFGAVDLGLRDFSASEDDLLLDTICSGAGAEHDDTGFDNLYCDTVLQTRARSSIFSDDSITSGFTSSLGTEEDRANFVFGSGEESLTKPTEGDHSVEEDLLFGDRAGTIAAAENSTLPSQF